MRIVDDSVTELIVFLENINSLLNINLGYDDTINMTTA